MRLIAGLLSLNSAKANALRVCMEQSVSANACETSQLEHVKQFTATAKLWQAALFSETVRRQMGSGVLGPGAFPANRQAIKMWCECFRIFPCDRDGPCAGTEARAILHVCLQPAVATKLLQRNPCGASEKFAPELIKRQL